MCDEQRSDERERERETTSDRKDGLFRKQVGQCKYEQVSVLPNTPESRADGDQMNSTDHLSHPVQVDSVFFARLDRPFPRFGGRGAVATIKSRVQALRTGNQQQSTSNVRSIYEDVLIVGDWQPKGRIRIEVGKRSNQERTDVFVRCSVFRPT